MRITTISNLGMKPIQIAYQSIAVGSPTSHIPAHNSGKLTLVHGGRVIIETARLNLAQLATLARNDSIICSHDGSDDVQPVITPVQPAPRLQQPAGNLQNWSTYGATQLASISATGVLSAQGVTTAGPITGSTGVLGSALIGAAFIRPDGSMGLASLADSAAANNSLYYSTTSSKLCYKDAAGSLHTLT